MRSRIWKHIWKVYECADLSFGNKFKQKRCNCETICVNWQVFFPSIAVSYGLSSFTETPICIGKKYTYESDEKGYFRVLNTEVVIDFNPRSLNFCRPIAQKSKGCVQFCTVLFRSVKLSCRAWLTNGRGCERLPDKTFSGCITVRQFRASEMCLGCLTHVSVM